jgi:hypothetical protein
MALKSSQLNIFQVMGLFSILRDGLGEFILKMEAILLPKHWQLPARCQNRITQSVNVSYSHRGKLTGRFKFKINRVSLTNIGYNTVVAAIESESVWLESVSYHLIHNNSYV